MSQTVELLTFQDALALARQSFGKAALLLGNGFSIACDPKIFTYSSLLQYANLTTLSIKPAERLFRAARTNNFEQVIRDLRRSSDLISCYGKQHQQIASQMRSDSDALRDALIDVVSSRHPAHQGVVQPIRYCRTARYLSNFTSIFTLNYDLLLYWTVMKHNVPAHDDGFRRRNVGLVWDEEVARAEQDLFFLHGALHLFEVPPHVRKHDWSATGVPIVQQVGVAIQHDEYPLFVMEGSSQGKLEQIYASEYLRFCLARLQRCSEPLFTFGWSMDRSDDHIAVAVVTSRTPILFVGVHGGPSNTQNQRLIRRAQSVAAQRSGTHRLHVHFFDAASAGLW